MTNTKKLSDEEEVALYEVLKELPDFRSMPIPASWFKKFNIPSLEVINPKSFMESNYTMKCAAEIKELPPLIIDEPIKDKDGKVILAELRPPEDIKVEVISRPFVLEEGKPFPAVLPMLAELPVIEEDMEKKRIARHEAWRSTLTDEQRERDTMLDKTMFDNLNNPDYVAPESEED